MDLVFQGWAALRRGSAHPDAVAKARDFFERALGLDPDDVEALVGAGEEDARRQQPLGGDPAFMVKAEASLAKALAAAPNRPDAHMMMGLLLCLTNRPARGIEELERALAIDPNLAAAHGHIGFAHSLLGRADRNKRPTLRKLCASRPR